ncbi:MAG: citrate/2-methylcitrate synthase [Rhizomicrobium sp.]
MAGFVALKGPRHGGVGPLAAKLLDTLLEGDIAAIVRERVALGERFPGFGHMVLSRWRSARRIAARRPDPDRHRQAPRGPRFRRASWKRRAPSPIATYALAVLRRTLDMPAGSETTLFAMARVAGWVAHASEQLETRKLIRPRARYIGPTPAPLRKR